MGKIDWKKEMEWGDEQVQELRIIGFAYIRQGKYDIALPFFEALHVLDPDSCYDAQTLGALYVQTNQPAKAVKILDQALKMEADHASTLINLTKALLMMGKKEEGIKLASLLARERDPQIANTAKALLLAYS